MFRVADSDPGSGAFLTTEKPDPRYGMNIPDHFSDESLETVFRAKNTSIL